ncbi:MAG TPA: hypothetical protein VL262_14620 [Vicinamibacterales bacterium]|nr:hypothetical protein [Vicinamibacterales bacterium]
MEVLIRIVASDGQSEVRRSGIEAGGLSFVGRRQRRAQRLQIDRLTPAFQIANRSREQ